MSIDYEAAFGAEPLRVNLSEHGEDGPRIGIQQNSWRRSDLQRTVEQVVYFVVGLVYLNWFKSSCKLLHFASDPTALS